MMRTILIILASLMMLPAMAQVPLENKAIASGETLVYDLYFNWKFIWVKCGRASMTTISTRYNGQPALKTHLITRGSEQADHFFIMRDTLVGMMTEDLIPLYFRKGAEEGSRYTVDEVSYSYANSKVNMNLAFKDKDGNWSRKKEEFSGEVYDMISMLNRARSLDASALKPGQKIKFQMAEGKRVETQTLIFRRRDVFKSNSGVKYKCLVMSFVEYENNKEKEIITFYISDDDNHLPLRLDLNLKFGSAKAFFSSGRGQRHPMSSKISK